MIIDSTPIKPASNPSNNEDEVPVEMLADLIYKIKIDSGEKFEEESKVKST